MKDEVAGEAARRIANFFESLAPLDLARLETVYVAEALFTDPFHEVQGLDRVRRIYEDMFQTLDEPRFRVTTTLAQGAQCCLVWDFRFRLKRGGGAVLLRGASHLLLAADGRIQAHRDYWDAAQLYEQLPLLGAPMRWLRRRAAR